MMGDYHVRFCERLGVKLPLPTRCSGVVGHIANPHKAHLGFANTQRQCKKIQMSLILLNRKKGERQRQMNELCKYSEILTEVAKKKLQEYCNTENLPFSDLILSTPT